MSELYLQDYPDLGEVVDGSPDIRGHKIGICLDCYDNNRMIIPEFLRNSHNSSHSYVFTAGSVTNGKLVRWPTALALLADFAVPEIKQTIERGAEVYLFGLAPGLVFTYLAYKLGTESLSKCNIYSWSETFQSEEWGPIIEQIKDFKAQVLAAKALNNIKPERIVDMGKECKTYKILMTHGLDNFDDSTLSYSTSVKSFDVLCSTILESVTEKDAQSFDICSRNISPFLSLCCGIMAYELNYILPISFSYPGEGDGNEKIRINLFSNTFE